LYDTINNIIVDGKAKTKNVGLRRGRSVRHWFGCEATRVDDRDVNSSILIFADRDSNDDSRAGSCVEEKKNLKND